MDLKQPEAMTKEQSQNTRAAEQQSMSQTSSSSVYSSADSTPTSNDQSNEGDELITTVTTSSEEAETEEETPTLRQTSEEDEETATAEKPSETTDEPSSPAPAPLPAAVTAAKAYYEDLVKDCKVRMANKFDALEAETGLRLTEDGGLCMVEQAAPVPPPREAPKSTNPFLNSSSTSTSHSSSNGSVVQQQQQTNDQNSTTLRGLDYVRMEKELRRLKEELALKNDIVEKMCRIRTQVEAELEDLTASLFEEANKMVYQANVLRDRTEKDLVEATLKIDMLTAEVDALKLLSVGGGSSTTNADTSHFPKRCALLEVPRTCSHRMKLQTEDKRWYAISALCRNRIAAVCDLFCYLGYIKSGLVKSDTRAMYWQIMRRRHSIVTSKLGFQWTSGVHQ
ncbi:RAB3A interacting protein [Tyrophagus putrescentiae]|nr:RAB3A interacting protein [Tyrophagus putrescentiae]